MNSSAVRKRHRLRQLALSGQIAGNVFVGGEILYFRNLVLVRQERTRKQLKVEPQVRRAFEKSVEKVEAVNIYNGFHFVTLYKTLEPGLLPAPHRIAVAQRVVSNPSWGSWVLYQISCRDVRG